ncbi:MAG TPA: hypothetical protein VGK67_22495 [Myxococcales bacterium]|jgi:hypothetical protein
MSDKPSYLSVALGLNLHKAILLAGAVGTVFGLWRGTWAFFFLFLAVEAFYLLALPLLPGFRRWVDQTHASEAAHQKAVDLDRIAGKLSPNAKARLDGVTRTREKILDAVRTLNAPEAMEREWRAKLDELVNASLRILVAIDGTRVDDRDTRLLESEINDLKAELAKLPDGPAQAAKAQRLEVLERRSGGKGKLAEQREAAVTQFETLEDLLKELQDQALAGRDSAAFGQRLAKLSAQIEAAGETVAALDRASETSSELAALRAGK